MATVLNFPKTLNALGSETAAPVTLKPGDRGESVKQLQGLLKSFGFDPGPVDGVYGKATAEAVRALQRKLGLTADGIFGPLTREAVTRDLGSKTSVIRQTQSAMGLTQTGPSTPSFPTAPPEHTLPADQKDNTAASGGTAADPASPTPDEESGLRIVLKSPVFWTGLALAAGGGLMLWYRAKQRRGPAPSAAVGTLSDGTPCAGCGAEGAVQGIEEYRPLRVPKTKSGRKALFGRCAKKCKGDRSCMSTCLRQ